MFCRFFQELRPFSLFFNCSQRASGLLFFFLFSPLTLHSWYIFVSLQETNELVAIKKFKDSEGEWVSERASEGEEKEGGATGKGGWEHHPNLFCRKWGGQGDDASGAEDAADPEAGQHCGAEGSFSQERKTLPGLWICWEGQFNSAVTSLRTHTFLHRAILRHLGLQDLISWAWKKTITMATYCTEWNVVYDGIPHCVAKVSSQVSISWQVLFSCSPLVTLVECPLSQPFHCMHGSGRNRLREGVYGNTQLGLRFQIPHYSSFKVFFGWCRTCWSS